MLVVCVVRCVCVWLRERCAYDHRAVACDHIDGCVVVCVVLSARACEYCNDHKLTLINVSLIKTDELPYTQHPTPNQLPSSDRRYPSLACVSGILLLQPILHLRRHTTNRRPPTLLRVQQRPRPRFWSMLRWRRRCCLRGRSPSERANDAATWVPETAGKAAAWVGPVSRLRSNGGPLW